MDTTYLSSEVQANVTPALVWGREGEGVDRPPKVLGLLRHSKINLESPELALEDDIIQLYDVIRSTITIFLEKKFP